MFTPLCLVTIIRSLDLIVWANRHIFELFSSIIGPILCAFGLIYHPLVKQLSFLTLPSPFNAAQIALKSN